MRDRFGLFHSWPSTFLETQAEHLLVIEESMLSQQLCADVELPRAASMEMSTTLQNPLTLCDPCKSIFEGNVGRFIKGDDVAEHIHHESEVGLRKAAAQGCDICWRIRDDWADSNLEDPPVPIWKNAYTKYCVVFNTFSALLDTELPTAEVQIFSYHRRRSQLRFFLMDSKGESSVYTAYRLGIKRCSCPLSPY